MTAPSGSISFNVIDRAAAAVLIIAVLVRILTPFDPFPAWAGDPTLSPTAIVGLTPISMSCVDLLALAAAMAVIVRHSGQYRLLSLAAITLGSATAAFFGAIRPEATPEDFILTLSWTAAITGGFAARTLVQDTWCRQLVVGSLLAAAVPLAGRAIYQVVVENPETIRAFKANREATFATFGWSPDSAMAAAYERRVLQNEASGYIGLANIFASLIGSLFVAWTLLLVGRIFSKSTPSSPRLPPIILTSILAAASLAGLVLAGAKGGYAMVALGIGLGVILRTLTTPPRLAFIRDRLTSFPWMLASAVVLFPLAAVALRGIIGLASGERSLLFRWYYLLGSARMMLEHPLGVGPSGYRDAYMLLKIPTAPEDISSPHSIFFDSLTQLGLLGAGFVLAWLILTVAASRTAFASATPETDSSNSSSRSDATPRPFAFLMVFAAATILATFLTLAINAPDAAALRIGCLIAATVVAVIASRTGLLETNPLHLPLAAAALAAVAHCQIELTASNPSSVAFVLLLLGSAAGLSLKPKSQPKTRTAKLRASWSVLALALLTAFGLRMPALVHWEHALRYAAAHAAPIVEAQEILRVFSSRSLPTPERNQLEEQLRSLGHTTPFRNVGRDRTPPEAALTQLRTDQLAFCQADLDIATRSWPTHFETLRAWSRVTHQHAELLHTTPTRTTEATLEADRAVDTVEKFAQSHHSAAAWAWVATLLQQRARGGVGPEAWEPISWSHTRIVAALIQAHTLSPYEPRHPAELAEQFERVGDHANAATWAREALRIDALTRLDPTRGLTDTQRAHFQSLVPLR